MTCCLVCPCCGTRWKIEPGGAGDREALCPVCVPLTTELETFVRAVIEP